MIAASTAFPASDEPIDPTIRRIVGRTVHRLVRSGKIDQQDARDLEQDLFVRVLKSRPAFDPSQSHLYAFATMVVARSVATLLRDRRAEKRDPARSEPLTHDVDADCDDVALAELSLDVATVLARMPENLRDLAERLKSASVSVVACDMNVPRTSLYRDVGKLREWFEQAGLGADQ